LTIRRRNRTRIEAERPHLQPLPSTPALDYDLLTVRVSTSSTLQVRRVTYTVPARLIGERLNVHLFDDRLELYHGTTLVLTLNRVYPTSARATRAMHRLPPRYRVARPQAYGSPGAPVPRGPVAQ
jgi:hypothetical protein